MRNVLHDRYYNIRNMRMEDNNWCRLDHNLNPSGIDLPEVHGVDKGLNQHVRPEKQTLKHTAVTPETKTPT